MLRLDGQYVFGVMVLTNHLLMSPWSTDVLAQFAPRLVGYKVNKKTIRIPVDWTPDADLLRDMVEARIAETSG